MFRMRTNLHAHALAVASASTPLLGIRLDDIKWLISVAVSMFGSLIALYICRENSRSQAKALEVHEAERRRQAARVIARTCDPAKARIIMPSPPNRDPRACDMGLEG